MQSYRRILDSDDRVRHFACAVLWCVLAFMAFTADSREEEFGDVVEGF